MSYNGRPSEEPAIPPHQYTNSPSYPPNSTKWDSATIPLNSSPVNSHTYSQSQSQPQSQINFQEKDYAEPRPENSRNSSWFTKPADTANSSTEHLQFAEGDVSNTGVGKVYYKLITSNIIVRWSIFILPILALLWIPGILGVTATPNAAIWGTPLLWWSIWFTVVWVGWWAAFAFCAVLPVFVKNTLGVISVNMKKYSEYLAALRRFVTLFIWSLVNWITFLILVNARATSDVSGSTRTLIASLLFGIMLSTVILLAEKLVVQIVAYNFHQTSFADRLSIQKDAIKDITTLYIRSKDLGRSDTLDGYGTAAASIRPTAFFKKLAKGARNVATSSTTALGNIASEIAGSSVLQPNSPRSRVTSALSSPNKTRQLAKRIFHSFCPADRKEILIEDIVKYFPTLEDAQRAFGTFDKDDNGDVSRDEVEAALMDVHREQLALEASLRNLDSAVGRLDAILVTLVLIIDALILAATLDTKITSLITSFSAFVLSVSWLIGTTAQEILGALLFLFAKHPYDVGDKVTFDGETYFVQEMLLLSTVFKRVDGTTVQAPNNVLNQKLIQNIRRSGPISEKFEFDVAFDTTFEQIEALRTLMLEFLNREKRDFIPQIDINVIDFPQQEKLTLSTEIKHKTSWQNGALKVQRANKFKCAMKALLSEVPIFGPKGDPDADGGPAQYQMVPYVEPTEEEKAEKARKEEEKKHKNKDALKSNENGEMAFSLGDAQAARRGGDNEVFDQPPGSTPGSVVNTPAMRSDARAFQTNNGQTVYQQSPLQPPFSQSATMLPYHVSPQQTSQQFQPYQAPQQPVRPPRVELRDL